MPIYFLGKSKRATKKFYVRELNSNKTIHFGQEGAEDYTIHKDKSRKELYIARHAKRENWDDPETAGFWSRWLLWSEPTIKKSIKNIEKKFGIKVRLLKTDFDE